VAISNPRGRDDQRERYLITPASIDRHIAMIIERSQAPNLEQPRPAATVRSGDALEKST